MRNKVLQLEPTSIKEGDLTLWKKDEDDMKKDEDDIATSRWWDYKYDGAYYQQQRPRQQGRQPAMAGSGSVSKPSREERAAKRKDDLIKLIHQPTISVNQYAGVYRIPSEDVDKTLRDPKFQFFRVDSGMNINVPRGKIKELRFRIVLYGDGKQSKSVFEVSGFPNDKIKNVKILSGKIGLSINNMLRIIPHPVTESVANIVTMDLNPWQIDWAYDKLQVGFSEAMTNNLDWFLSSDNVNQSFQCYLTLKKHTSVKRVSAKVSAVWKFQAYDEGIREWFSRKFHNKLYEVKCSAKQIEIIE